MVVECSSVFLGKFTHPLQNMIFKNNFENFTIFITPNPDNIRTHLIYFFNFTFLPQFITTFDVHRAVHHNTFL